MGFAPFRDGGLGAYRRSEGVNPVRHRGPWDDQLLSKVVHLIALEKCARGVVRKQLVAGPRVLEGVRVSVQVRGVVRILGDCQDVQGVKRVNQTVSPDEADGDWLRNEAQRDLPGRSLAQGSPFDNRNGDLERNK